MWWGGPGRTRGRGGFGGEGGRAWGNQGFELFRPENAETVIQGFELFRPENAETVIRALGRVWWGGGRARVGESPVRAGAGLVGGGGRGLLRPENAETVIFCARVWGGGVGRARGNQGFELFRPENAETVIPPRALGRVCWGGAGARGGIRDLSF